MNVLVIDDEPDMLDLLRWDLEDAGATVFTALSAKQALQTVKDYELDFIISDIRIGSDNGVELLKTFKGEMNLPCDIVLISGFADITEEEALALGAKKLLSKPFDFNILVDSIVLN